MFFIDIETKGDKHCNDQEVSHSLSCIQNYAKAKAILLQVEKKYEGTTLAIFGRIPGHVHMGLQLLFLSTCKQAVYCDHLGATDTTNYGPELIIRACFTVFGINTYLTKGYTRVHILSKKRVNVESLGSLMKHYYNK